MGSGFNIVLFDPADADVTRVTYYRIRRAAYFSEPLSANEQVYEEGPYDWAVTARDQ
jgi:hypothetical protein